MEHLCAENEIPKDIHAPPGTMVILYFESDDTYSKRGFTLDWSKNCGGNIVVESQGQGLVKCLRVVQTQAILFLKSMSERVGSDIERL